MQKFLRFGPLVLLMLFSSTLLLNGCAGFASAKPVDRFAADVDTLIEQLFGQRSSADLAPAAIVCQSLKEGRPLSRLEEFIAERLAWRLRHHREIYTLTRQNWLELRERQPLTFAGEAADRRNLLRGLALYEIAARYEPILQQLTLTISSGDAAGRTVPGKMAQIRLEITPDHPAESLLTAAARGNPLPEGVEDNPYVSLDRLAFSLIAELSDAYRNGIRAEGRLVADTDVRVVLCGSADTPRSRIILAALQQALARQAGFTGAVSTTDLKGVFRQIDVYRANRRHFLLDGEPLNPGSVYLLLEETAHPDPGKIGVALRAVWRTAPLEDADGDLIPTSAAGTYLSGFAAKAYLASAALGTDMGRNANQSASHLYPAVRQYTPAQQQGFD